MLRSQLSLHALRLSPIPGSPSADFDTDPFRQLFEEAIGQTGQDSRRASPTHPEATRAHTRGFSLPNPSRIAGQTTADLSQYSDMTRWPLLDRSTSGFGTISLRSSMPARPRLPSDEQRAINQSVQGKLPSPQVIRAVAPSVPTARVITQPSKADTSENWRLKSEKDPPAVVNRSEVVPTTPKQNDKNAAPDVMTIDSLFAKFEKVGAILRGN